MRYLFVLTLMLPLLSGCWFIYIPGSTVSAVSDSFTGAEGEHCVPETAKVGDRIKLTDGDKGMIKSLSGTSKRCRNKAFPIRALLVKE